jgi:uncharacterized membrane protein YphA (DoxX/SURF4 family)
MTASGAPRARTLTATSPPLVVLRAFFGIVYLANGLAKVFAISTVTLGPWRSFLIDIPGARGILSHDSMSSIGVYHAFASDLVLPHFDVFGPLLMVAEIAVGLGLITGVLGRLAAVGGFLLALNVGIAAIGAGEWTFEYLIEIVPLACLAALPTPTPKAVRRRLPAALRGL